MLILRKRPCLLALVLLQPSDAFVGSNKMVRSPPQRGGTSKMKFPSALHLRDQTCINNNSRSSSIGSMALDSSTESQPSTGQQQRPQNQSQNHHPKKTSRRNPNGHNSGGRKNNKAMGDTAFLRKRTAELLRLTTEAHLAKEKLHAESMIDTATASTNVAPQKKVSQKMKVGRKTFNFLIDAWAFSGERDAADQALKLLERMEELHKLPEINVSPDVRSYTKVINAVSRSKRPDAGGIAEGLLDKMVDAYSSGGNLEAKPNTFTYTAVIESYANSGVEGSAQKAVENLDRMIAQFESGDPDVRPTARCFNAVINSYAKSGYPGAAQQAEDLFYRMDNLYMAGVEEAKPNTFNYNSLMTVLANSDDEGSAAKAAAVLKRMERCYASGDPDCKPTTVSFNAVIDAYAKSGADGGAQKAEEVLLRMEDLNQSGQDVKPNTRSFNSVINAWAKSREENAELKAQDLLDFMTRLYKNGNEAVRPDVHTFCTVINAWARSQKPGKAEAAENLFTNMVKSYEAGNPSLRPNVVAVNAVMNACAYTSGDITEQNRAMGIAHGRLKELETSDFGSPDQVTYGTFLKVCANQMPDCTTRQQIIEVVFKKCVRDGQFGNLVLQQMKAMGPPTLYYKLIGRAINEDIKLEELPNDWRCNVVEGKWNRRRNH